MLEAQICVFNVVGLLCARIYVLTDRLFSTQSEFKVLNSCHYYNQHLKLRRIRVLPSRGGISASQRCKIIPEEQYFLNATKLADQRTLK